MGIMDTSCDFGNTPSQFFELSQTLSIYETWLLCPHVQTVSSMVAIDKLEQEKLVEETVQAQKKEKNEVEKAKMKKNEREGTIVTEDRGGKKEIKE